MLRKSTIKPYPHTLSGQTRCAFTNLIVEWDLCVMALRPRTYRTLAETREKVSGARCSFRVLAFSVRGGVEEVRYKATRSDPVEQYKNM